MFVVTPLSTKVQSMQVIHRSQFSVTKRNIPFGLPIYFQSNFWLHQTPRWTRCVYFSSERLFDFLLMNSEVPQWWQEEAVVVHGSWCIRAEYGISQTFQGTCNIYIFPLCATSVYYDLLLLQLYTDFEACNIQCALYCIVSRHTCMRSLIVNLASVYTCT